MSSQIQEINMLYQHSGERSSLNGNVSIIRAAFWKVINLFVVVRVIFYDFINLTQVHNFTVDAKVYFYLWSTSIIYHKFYRNCR